jgi:glucosamine 6-phosphate synthetase-like amidotransferase/phosphosugar isomerase protein
MCGIGGYYQTGSTENAPKWAQPALRKMWDTLQSRGTDASGVAYESPTGIRHYKTDKPAYELSGLTMNLAFGMNRSPRWVMLHTRAATHGKPELNRNNHPLMGNKMALCHNGVVYNKSNVLGKYNTSAKRDVDTEAILVALKNGGIDAVARHVEGSMSISWAKGKTMYLWTNGMSPLVIGELFNGDFMYSSTDEHLMSTGLRFKQVFDAKHGHLYKFTPEGMSVHKTHLRKIKRPTYSWRDLSQKRHTPKATRQSSLVCQPEQEEECVSYLDDIDVEWEAVYGDWRSWSKKSKEVRR